MRSIYVLSDYGVSLTILNNLYKNNITYLDIEFFGEMKLKESKITKKNIELILEAMDKAKNDKYQNSINELKLFGLSNNYFYKAIENNISIDQLSLTEDQFCLKYNEKPKFYKSLTDAYEKLKNNDYNLKYEDFSKYLLMIIKRNCEIISKSIENIYNKISQTSYPIEYFESDLNKLLDKKVISIINNEIEYISPGIVETISREEERIKEILSLRLSGKSLKEIGDSFNLSRERIRQIIVRLYDKIPYVKEDKYKVYFEEYDFSEEEFTIIFLEPKSTYYYLSDRYDKGNKEFYEIEDDYLLDEDMIMRIKKLKNEILIDNKFIIGNREGVLKYLMKSIGTEIKIDELYEKFNNFIDDRLKDYNIARFDSIHSLESFLEQKKWSISESKRTVRYYENKIIDVSDLNTIRKLLLSHEGLYSTLYLFENNLDYMKQIDIRNEQELHNFLKKNILDLNIEYLRMPNILINCNDKNLFIISLIHQYSPITLVDFCKILREQYGHREDTMASYLSLEFGKYITNGLISTSIIELTYDESEKIMKKLDKIIYSREEVERILEDLDIKNSIDFLNNINLNKLGYKIVGQFVVKKSFDRLEDAFYKSIERGELEKDIVKTNSTSYTYVLRLLKDRKILELNKTYIPFDFLYKIGITRDDIVDFEKKLNEIFVNEDEYFTAFNVKKKINCNLLNRFSISDDIINGIIYSFNGYRKISWKENIIYIKSQNVESRVKFIESLLKKYNGVSVSDIKEILMEEYHIQIQENDIKQILYAVNSFKHDNKIYYSRDDYQNNNSDEIELL